MIQTNILQSMLALNATQIEASHMFMQSYVECRTHASQAGLPEVAEEFNRKVDKERGKIAKLVRNQKAIKQEIGVNAYHDYMNKMAEEFEEY